MKTLKKSKYQVIDEGLVQFISKTNSQGIPINTLLLKEKAKELAITNNIPDFKCSNGFIERFNVRNEVIFPKIHGGGLSS